MKVESLACLVAVALLSGCSKDEDLHSVEAPDSGEDAIAETSGNDSTTTDDGIDSTNDDTLTTDSGSPDTTVVDSGSDSASTDVATDGTTPSAFLWGKVDAGGKLVSGSKVTAYVAGDGTSAAKAVACVTTDATGVFQFGTTSASLACAGSSLPTDFACPAAGCPTSGQQIYLVAKGGNPGLASGTDNDALALSAMIGKYGDLGASTSVIVSPLTTVAATYAVGPMMDATGTLVSFKPSSLDLAVARTTFLVSSTTSTFGASMADPSTCTGDFTDPLTCEAETKLASLADALSACAKTTGITTTACKRLLCDATPGVTFSSSCSVSAVPTNTLEAARGVARNPGKVAISDLFALSGTTTAYAPALMMAPNDWTLSLTFRNTSMNHVLALAVDGAGQVWITNGGNDSLTVLSPLGVPISGSPFSGGGLNFPSAIAVDGTGHVWLANTNGNSVSAFTTAGAVLSGSPFTGGGLKQPNGVAIDASGHVWISNATGDSVTELSSAGAALSTSTGFTGGGLKAPFGITTDASGNVWVSSNGTGAGDSSVSKLSPAGAALSPSTGYAGGSVDHPNGIAVDASGNVWVASANNDRILKYSSAGALLSPATGYTGGGIGSPRGLAVDGAGHVFVANNFTRSVTELDASGATRSPAKGYTSRFTAPDWIGLAIDPCGDVWITSYDEPIDRSSVVEYIGVAAPVKTPTIGPATSP